MIINVSYIKCLTRPIELELDVDKNQSPSKYVDVDVEKITAFICKHICSYSYIY